MKSAALHFSGLIPLLLVLLVSTQVSSQNALDFDGINDRINTTNASALIANSEMSMALWVNPTNPAAGWPDFDGFAGFRDDFSADFYLLQLNSTTVEARFRNSAGLNFDIAYSGLLLNTWNHFVMTYDGALLRLYHNGNLAGSVAASGYITSTTTPLNIGMVPFSGNDFYLDGRLDEVGLWSKELSAGEISTIYNACTIDVNDIDLQLCYKFDQGIGGANNAGITSATDSQGNLNGVMSGFGLTGTTSNFITYGNMTASFVNASAACSYTSPSGNYQWMSSGSYSDTLVNSIGCDSIITINLTLTGVNSTNAVSVNSCSAYTSPSGNYTWSTSGQYLDTVQSVAGCDSIFIIDLVVGQASSSSITEAVCEAYVSPSGNYTWSSSGQYTDIVQNAAGCDSVITINLSVTIIDTSVTVVGATLTADASGASYQWINCQTGAAIAGATNQSYTASSNGSYALVITSGGCQDTSSCYTIANLGTIENDLSLDVKVYPNPIDDHFSVELGALSDELTVTIMDVVGNVVFSNEYHSAQLIQLALNESPGVYVLVMESLEKRSVIRLVKN